MNKIGLEAEFLLRKDGKLVYPSEHGFSCDDFCILGEFRAEPGETREETIANFYKEYYKILFATKNRGLTIDISKGWDSIQPDFHAQIMRKMGSKSVAVCKNIHNTDILSLTDAESENGKIISQKISTGLHIHFSANDVKSQDFTKDNYEMVKLPINLNNAEACFELYRKLPNSVTQKITVQSNKISRPVIKHIVESLDKDILPKFNADLPKLKYRNPGFYETKTWGFEYRSLPFNENVLKNIDSIVDYSFKLLEDLY